MYYVASQLQENDELFDPLYVCDNVIMHCQGSTGSHHIMIKGSLCEDKYKICELFYSQLF